MRRRPCKGRGGEHLYPGRPGASATRSTLSTPSGSFPSSGGSARLVRLGSGTAGRLGLGSRTRLPRQRSRRARGDLPLPPLSWPAQSGRRLETSTINPRFQSHQQQAYRKWGSVINQVRGSIIWLGGLAIW
jgi:hypothetical protein